MPSSTLNIHAPRLLTELPHFFRSLQSALAEMLQNSTRSGATHVDLTLDAESRTLRIQDNGPGVHHPENLWTAAQSGWDDPTITDPAGLGFFALLGLSQSLQILSRQADGTGWTTTIPATAFHGEAFAVETLPPDPTQPSGLTLTAALQPEADLDAVQNDLQRLRQWEKIPSWRHAFPLEVTWHDAEGDVAIPMQWDQTTTTAVLPTPIGDLTAYKHDRHPGTRSSFIVQWEFHCIPAPREALSQQIRALAGAHADAILASLPHYFRWTVAPGSDVRPQLPERSAMITNTPWTQAMKTLAQSIIAAFAVPDRIRESQDALAQAPDVFQQETRGLHLPTAQKILAPCTPQWAASGSPFFEVPPPYRFQWAGYHRVSVPEPFSTNGYWDDDGDGRERENIVLWMRHVPESTDSVVVDLCNMQGYWTLPATDDAPAQIRSLAYGPIERLDRLFDAWLYVGRTPEIRVLTNDAPCGTLNFGVQVSDDTPPTFIFTQPDPEVLPLTSATQELPYAYLIDEFDSDNTWWDYRVENDDIDFSPLTHQILRAIEDAWAPQKAQQRRDQERQLRIQRTFRAMNLAIEQVRTIADLPAPFLAALDQVTGTCEAAEHAALRQGSSSD